MMKPAGIPLVLVAAAMLAACAYLPRADAPARRVSPDYTASGEALGARAYLYGKRTVLEFENAPALLIVKDETGASVAHEKIGRHYRLARKLDHFTAWMNGRAVTFSYVKPLQAAAPPPASAPAPAAAPVPVVQMAIPAQSPADADLSALLKLTEKQLEEIRRVIEAAGQNRTATGEELYAAITRLNEIQARLASASSAVVQVKFATSDTRFKPGPEVARVLLAAAQVADQIRIHGRTDARVAGPADPRIALGRAMAARTFLVNNGIDADKIQVFSKPDGDFVAPNLTRKGKALNRRVEVEIVHSRIAHLHEDPIKVAAR